ncbi:MAG: aminotransferase class IV, partial [Bacteroidota bacterium]|nr:aminotransferase class IV [Bacteroidota bacterium]
ANGHVAETGAAAIFWVKNEGLFTPALESGCVAGVRRAQVLRAARAAGMACREGLFGRDELLRADSVFTANVAAVRIIYQIQLSRFSNPQEDFLHYGTV